MPILTAEWIVQATPFVVVLAMLTLGLELTVADFTRQGRRWRLVLTATLLQPFLLSAVALVALSTFRPTPDLIVPMLALGAAPGGVLSNAYTYLVRGDVALSITLTASSTLLAPVVIPVVLPLVAQVAGISLEATGWTSTDLVRRLLLTILLPVGIGMAVRARWPAWVQRWRRSFAVLTALAVAVILVPALLQAVTAPVSDVLTVASYAAGFTLAAMTVALPAAFLLTKDPKARIALAIEFGVRNIPIAVMLVAATTSANAAVLFFAVYFLLDAPIALLLGTWLRRVQTVDPS